MVGFIVSVPVAAWMSPRSGSELRRTVVQRGLIVRRQVGQSIRKPLERVQDQIEQLRSDSVETSLDEGKSIAARQQAESVS
jgi:gas vesicle protein